MANNRFIWRFSALDTLFFRDGTPYHQGESGNVMPQSLFPPMMFTIQGAIRTALAVHNGWNVSELPKELGNAEHLGDLKLKGPYLEYKGKRLYQAPLHILGKKTDNEWKTFRLTPGPPVTCDMGRVRLPTLDQRMKKNDAMWLTQRGLDVLLHEDLPNQEEIVEQERLWKTERKIGIQRNIKTETTDQKSLYFLEYVRPDHELNVVVEVSGIPDEWHPTSTLILPLGGEGRFAQVSIEKEEQDSCWRVPSLHADSDGKVRFTVSLLTPGYFVDDDPSLEGNEQVANVKQVIHHGPPEIPGTCVSACIGKMIMIGGWDLKNRRPRPILPLIPPGSTWFYEADASEMEKIMALHKQSIGGKQAYGMGEIVIGTWKDTTKGEQ